MRSTRWLATCGVAALLAVVAGTGATAVAQTEAPASPAASGGAVACGDIPPTLPADNSGVLAGLPAETLAGYYMIEAADLDEAVAVGKRIPGGAFGTVEIRPVHPLEDLPTE